MVGNHWVPPTRKGLRFELVFQPAKKNESTTGWARHRSMHRRQTNKWNLNIPPLAKGKHRPKPPIPGFHVFGPLAPENGWVGRGSFPFVGLGNFFKGVLAVKLWGLIRPYFNNLGALGWSGVGNWSHPPLETTAEPQVTSWKEILFNLGKREPTKNDNLPLKKTTHIFLGFLELAENGLLYQSRLPT